MQQISKRSRFSLKFWLALLALLAMVVLASSTTLAAAPPAQNPQSGSLGLEGTISTPPPSQAATITSPADGHVFTSIPITVAGLCPQGTMVKLFSNNIFVGAVTCSNGSYSLQIDLFSGQNDLIARVFDDLDQPGPDSNTVHVIFNDSQFTSTGSRVSLTSIYAKYGANPGATIQWPIIISGGTPPYALSVDWGDGKPISLKSVGAPGTVDVDHIYDAAGIYRVVVKATDAKGSTAYLQLIGVANGEIKSSGNQTADDKSGTVTVTKIKYSFIPVLVMLPLIILAFWLGRKYELQALRRRIEDSTSSEYQR